MYQFFVEPSQIQEAEKKVTILGTDVNHIKNVLRMKIGEEVNVSNGIDGREDRCSILSLEEDRINLELQFIKEDQQELPVEITLFQGLPKADKMEFIIQKAVELGAVRIVPLSLSRCVVKLDSKKEKNKLERWQQIAEAAAKQSKRGKIPKIEPVMTMKEAVRFASEMECKMIPYELAKDIEDTRRFIGSIQPGMRVAVFIGPEGGFSEQEIELAVGADIKPVTLGKRILRTETAGMCVLSILMYELEK